MKLINSLFGAHHVRLEIMHRSLAIVEHDPVWRHWLKRMLPQLPDVLGASFHSAPALLESSALRDVDLLIVSYRPDA